MLNPFQWLRTMAREAVLGGVADALTEIHDPDGATRPTLQALGERLGIEQAGEVETPAGKRTGKKG